MPLTSLPSFTPVSFDPPEGDLVTVGNESARTRTLTNPRAEFEGWPRGRKIARRISFSGLQEGEDEGAGRVAGAEREDKARSQSVE